MSAPDELPVALERLVALGQSPDVNIRPVLLRVVVDMFVRKEHHAPADLQQFATIVSHLLDDADPDARLLVADKLSRHPATPRILLDRFVAEQGLLACTVYRHAELDDETLGAAAAWGGVEVATALAGRPGLTPSVVTALVERPENAVLCELARNADATLDRASFQKLARRARTDDELAALLARRAADPLDLAPLFHLVGAEQRQAIIEASRRSELGKRQWGRLDGTTAAALDQMDRLVRCGERDAFETLLSRALGIKGDHLIPLLHDPGGEALALALTAAGATPDMAARVFILGDPRIGHSVAKVRALVHIVETLSAHAARRLIDAMAGSAESRRRNSVVARQPAPARRIEQAASSDAIPARRDVQPSPIPNRRHG